MLRLCFWMGCLLGVLTTGSAQSSSHHFSIYGGWTYSHLQRSSTAPLTPDARIPLHFPYMGFEYEHNEGIWRLSSGVICTVFGANDDFTPGSQLPYADAYLAIPLMIGPRWQLGLSRRDASFLTLEIGIELGFALVHYHAQPGSTWGNINAAAALEWEHRRFRFGSRLQLGVTDYRVIQGVTYRHLGVTTYVGYELWAAAHWQRHVSLF